MVEFSQKHLKLMVYNIYPFDTRKEVEQQLKALREVLQDIEKLGKESEPKPNAIIRIKEESEENQ